MIPGRSRAQRHCPRKPRASGDDPPADRPAYSDPDVNPARAGMILRRRTHYFPALSKPRASGDDPTSMYLCQLRGL